jgi:hypothetical protein
VSETQVLDLGYRWDAVNGEGGPYRFPEKITRSMRALYDGPAVYCWSVDWPGRAPARYVGETENMIRRLRAFLQPGPTRETNWRLKQYLKAARARRVNVTLEVLRFEPFVVNGFKVTMRALTNPHVRRLLENLVILTEMQAWAEVLNRGTDLGEKRWKRLVKAAKSASVEEKLRMVELAVKKIEIEKQKISE